MAKLKIILEKGETPLDADNALLKALEMHVNGKVHNDEKFADPAMSDLETKLAKINADMLNNLLREIEAELDKEYSE